MLHFIYYRENDGSDVKPLSEDSSNFYEITICIRGEMKYYLNSKPIVLKSGDAVVFPPSTMHKRDEVTNTNYVSYNFSSTEDIDLPIVIHNCITTPIKQIFALSRTVIPMRQFVYNDERYEAILDCLIKQLKHDLSKTKDKPIISKIKGYIEGHLNEKISLTDIEEVTFFSKSYCDMLFKKETGQSITDYIIGTRIQKAQSMMFEKTYTLKEIAEGVGYSDMNYFSRIFKSRTGLSPTQYMKLNSNK